MDAARSRYRCSLAAGKKDTLRSITWRCNLSVLVCNVPYRLLLIKYATLGTITVIVFFFFFGARPFVIVYTKVILVFKLVCNVSYCCY